MKTESELNFLKDNQKYLISIIFVVLITFLIFFKNSLFQTSFLLKELGKTSIDPEIAFSTNKPIFLEFYAEWCEVCKKMSPGVEELRKVYGKNINFVFLNVDNPKWEKYIKKMNVNGIPQINLYDKELNLEKTFIGLQDEIIIRESLKNIVRRSESENINNPSSKELSL
tara:strand:- start:357 stop:863 length:507 start_codon:yes stop_codon:yes gene_type:complete